MSGQLNNQKRDTNRTDKATELASQKSSNKKAGFFGRLLGKQDQQPAKSIIEPTNDATPHNTDLGMDFTDDLFNELSDLTSQINKAPVAPVQNTRPVQSSLVNHAVNSKPAKATIQNQSSNHAQGKPTQKLNSVNHKAPARPTSPVNPAKIADTNDNRSGDVSLSAADRLERELNRISSNRRSGSDTSKDAIQSNSKTPTPKRNSRPKVESTPTGDQATIVNPLTLNPNYDPVSRTLHQRDIAAGIAGSSSTLPAKESSTDKSDNATNQTMAGTNNASQSMANMYTPKPPAHREPDVIEDYGTPEQLADRLISKDSWLTPYRDQLIERYTFINKHRRRILGDRNISNFSLGHKYYGIHREDDGSWVFREWAPNATKIFLICGVTKWQDHNMFELKRVAGTNGDWELRLPASALRHLDLYKLHVYWDGGDGERLPSYTTYAVQDKNTKIFCAVVWHPQKDFVWQAEKPLDIPTKPFIYEAHIGMSGDFEGVSTYRQFENDVLPRIIDLGYNTIQLMAVQEHPYYGSFGYQVSNFFAPSSRFGTPNDLKHLIDAAHQAGIAVILDIVHSHSVKNENEGLSRFDGTLTQYFTKENHPAWDSRLFDYGKPQVSHMLLSNVHFWLDEYHFDGLRFDGVSSMLYRDHALGKSFDSYEDYFGDNINMDAVLYLTMANELVHTIRPDAITIAEDVSGFVGLAATNQDGGVGFDYRFNMGAPDIWGKQLRRRDEDWQLGKIVHDLTSARPEEKTINYAESHDQALVGDKTIIFKLLDKEMYHGMSKLSSSALIDRGIALHKMIRLLTACTHNGGYLNFMGNEFGHPEWIDFPRQGNNWSYKYARRQWHLVDDPDLRFSQLNIFDKSMVKLVKELQPTDYTNVNIDEDHKVLSFMRGDKLFIFNFSAQSYPDYAVLAPPRTYVVDLCSDDSRYGGFSRLDTKLSYHGEKQGDKTILKIYLPSRTAIVLKSSYFNLTRSPWAGAGNAK